MTEQIASLLTLLTNDDYPDCIFAVHVCYVESGRFTDIYGTSTKAPLLLDNPPSIPLSGCLRLF